MSDLSQSIPPVLVTAEVRAVAHELRAQAERLLTLAEAMPLPPEQVRRAVYEAASEEVFALHPVLDLYVDVRELAGGKLLELAGDFEELGRSTTGQEVPSA